MDADDEREVDCRDTFEADDAAEKDRASGGQADRAGVGDRDGEGEESLVTGGEAKWLSVLSIVGLRLVLM